jgi:hypothetical protein
MAQYEHGGNERGTWLVRLAGTPASPRGGLSRWRSALALAVGAVLVAVFLARVPGTVRARVWWVRHERSGAPDTAHARMPVWREFGRRCQEHLPPGATPLVLADPDSERWLACRYFLMPHRAVGPSWPLNVLLKDPSPLAHQWSSSGGTHYAVVPPPASGDDRRVADALRAELGESLQTEEIAGGILLTYRGRPQ